MCRSEPGLRFRTCSQPPDEVGKENALRIKMVPNLPNLPYRFPRARVYARAYACMCVYMRALPVKRLGRLGTQGNHIDLKIEKVPYLIWQVRNQVGKVGNP